MPIDKSPSTAQAKQKKQIIIVALLLVGLLAAILTQPSADEHTAGKATVAVIPELNTGKPQRSDADAPRSEFVTTEKLSRIDLDQVLQASLFAQPEPEPLPQVVTAEAVEPVEKVTVQAIYGNGNLTSIGNARATGEHRALIGESIIRQGEILPDGRQVVRVSPDGLELAP
jgi:hypothetical protein